MSYILLEIRPYKCCYDRNDQSEGIDVAKSRNSKECTIYHCWFFNYGFKFQNSVCNGCHNLTMLNLNINNIAIITVKGFDYHDIIHENSEAIHLLKNPVLYDRGYIKSSYQKNEY